jgi:hypothetical protein
MEITPGFDEDNSRMYRGYCGFPPGEPFESATRPTLMFFTLSWPANYG